MNPEQNQQIPEQPQQPTVQYPIIQPPVPQQPVPPVAPPPSQPPILGTPVEPARQQHILIVVPEPPLLVCEHCGSGFTQHTQRHGINYVSLIFIILLSLFMPLLIFLLICFCGPYPVCPVCGKFSGHGASKDHGICLC